MYIHYPSNEIYEVDQVETERVPNRLEKWWKDGAEKFEYEAEGWARNKPARGDFRCLITREGRNTRVHLYTILGQRKST